MSIYVNVDSMSYKGEKVFYKKPINIELHKATEYTSNYEYYYKENDETLKYLGKFIEFGMYRSDSYYDDTNYPIIVFQNENIFENKKEKIFCKGIPETIDNNMIAIKDMMYEGFPLYYSASKINLSKFRNIFIINSMFRCK